MDLQEKIGTNTWDNIDDVIKVLNLMKEGKWSWMNNSQCKYLHLRLDMRDGGCLIKNRYDMRIDPSDLEYQHK